MQGWKNLKSIRAKTFNDKEFNDETEVRTKDNHFWMRKNLNWQAYNQESTESILTYNSLHL
jgi:hypothetical protein